MAETRLIDADRLSRQVSLMVRATEGKEQAIWVSVWEQIKKEPTVDAVAVKHPLTMKEAQAIAYHGKCAVERLGRLRVADASMQQSANADECVLYVFGHPHGAYMKRPWNKYGITWRLWQPQNKQYRITAIDLVAQPLAGLADDETATQLEIEYLKRTEGFNPMEDLV